VRETREDFGSVDGGRTRPDAGLENGMGIDDRTIDVFGVGCVDTVQELLLRAFLIMCTVSCDRPFF
jgi:hypothetical protein